MPWQRSLATWVVGVTASACLGCGPELGPTAPEVRTGYYRAEIVEVRGTECVWTFLDSPGLDSGACLKRETLDSAFADGVPIRVDGDRLEVPESILVTPSMRLIMRPLTWTGSSFELQRSYSFSFCSDPIDLEWEVVPLDAETLWLTRDATGCGDEQAEDQIPATGLEMEFSLVEPCEPPCRFVAEEEFSVVDTAIQDPVLGHPSHCECSRP